MTTRLCPFLPSIFLTMGLAVAQPAAPAGDPARGETWDIPLAGNAYRTDGGGGRGGDGMGRRGMRWSDKETVFSVFFHVDRPAELELAMRLKVPQGNSKIRVEVAGASMEHELGASDEPREVSLGRVAVEKAGHVRVDLRGLERGGPVFAEPGDLRVTPVGEGAAEVKASYVRDNESNRFYWGRRGPSVHLGYELPRDRTIEWFYSELTVPEGEDPVGSYFMANGFGEGYFGIQVNSPEERRVLFSVWSPFHTDDPRSIPEDQKIRMLKKGEGVYTGEFGNEGSGGQSFLRYPWKAGVTYGFLLSGKPDGMGSTDYTGWFHAPEEGKWRLICSFKRPKTDKHLTGLHSFLENFADSEGYRGRRGYHGNMWARDTAGEWHEITRARFTGDDIANRRYRRDLAGGVTEDGRFFLRNGGFFDDIVGIGGRFERPSRPEAKPQIDFAVLE